MKKWVIRVRLQEICKFARFIKRLFRVDSVKLVIVVDNWWWEVRVIFWGIFTIFFGEFKAGVGLRVDKLRIFWCDILSPASAQFWMILYVDQRSFFSRFQWWKFSFQFRAHKNVSGLQIERPSPKQSQLQTIVFLLTIELSNFRIHDFLKSLNIWDPL